MKNLQYSHLNKLIKIWPSILDVVPNWIVTWTNVICLLINQYVVWQKYGSNIINVHRNWVIHDNPPKIKITWINSFCILPPWVNCTLILWQIVSHFSKYANSKHHFFVNQLHILCYYFLIIAMSRIVWITAEMNFPWTFEIYVRGNLVTVIICIHYVIYNVYASNFTLLLIKINPFFKPVSRTPILIFKYVQKLYQAFGELVGF